jgi:hypothetical protein
MSLPDTQLPISFKRLAGGISRYLQNYLLEINEITGCPNQ